MVVVEENWVVVVGEDENEVEIEMLVVEEENWVVGLGEKVEERVVGWWSEWWRRRGRVVALPWRDGRELVAMRMF